MSQPRYVQHKSGQGEKYKLEGCDNHDYAWRVCSYEHGYGNFYLYLPKPEYVLITPPEVWTDVTTDCMTDGRVISVNGGTIASIHRNDNQRDGSFLPYRLRKVKSCYIRKEKPVTEDPTYYWAFIIERRTP